MNTLTKESTYSQIEEYFKKVFELGQSGEKFPVNLEMVWPLVYHEKSKAVRELKTSKDKNGYVVYAQDVDYQVLAKNGQNSNGGRPVDEYFLSVSCLEFFIAKKVRSVFEVYRQVFHNTVIDVLPNFNNPAEAARAWADQFEKREIAEKELKTLEPKVKYCDEVLAADNCMTTTTIAKELGMSGVALNKVLKEKGIQFYHDGHYVLYSRYQDKGLTKLKTRTFVDPNGNMKTTHQTVWTEKGRVFIHNKITDLFKK